MEKRKLHLASLHSNITKARLLFPTHQFIFIGDFNCKHKDVNKIMEHCPSDPIERTNYNWDDKPTFKRNITKGTLALHQSATDHAFSIINQPNLRFTFKITKATDEKDGLEMPLEHHMISLTLDNLFKLGNVQAREGKVREDARQWSSPNTPKSVTTK